MLRLGIDRLPSIEHFDIRLDGCQRRAEFVLRHSRRSRSSSAQLSSFARFMYEATATTPAGTLACLLPETRKLLTAFACGIRSSQESVTLNVALPGTGFHLVFR